MARIRSPNYPAISLEEAIQRVAQVHAREAQHPASREVIIKGMGYNGVHGTSLSAISAAIKYGLLERLGKDGGHRVSDRAMAILHPHSPQEKAEAIEAAARSPALFSELFEYFKGGQMSDDNLRAYLVRRGFSQASLPEVIKAFRDTMGLVRPTAGEYPGSAEMEAPVIRQSPAGVPSPSSISSKGKPLSVLFNGDSLEVSAILADVDSVDRLIRILEVSKHLLPEPENETD